MSVFEAVALGVVQGFTEFLPVSSSGHLVLAQAVLGVELPGVAFETVVHVATLFAVVWVYRVRLLSLARGVGEGDAASVRYLLLLGLATVPAVAVGLLARDVLERAFERPVAAAAFLLVTGLVVWSLRWTARRATAREPNAGPALWAGVAQAVAILPGISRSGATVAAGVWRGVDAVRMAEFSFLMSIPAIGGAALLEAGAVGRTLADIGTAPLAAGFVAALLAGVAAIRLFVRTLERRSFHRFAYYCWAVGGGFLVAAWLAPGLR